MNKADTTGILQSPAFYAQNDALAKRYKKASPSLRQNLLEELYKLDIRLFQAWRLDGSDDREDYRQEAYLWLCRSLETYDPAKGPFVHWLRFYVRKTFESHVRTQKKVIKGDSTGLEGLASDEEAPDHVFWDRVKAVCTPDQWELVNLRFLQGTPITDIARLMGTYPAKVRAPLLAALDKVKAASLLNPHDSTKNISELDITQSRWLRKKDLAKTLGLRDEHLKDLLNPKRDEHACVFTIDPRDIVRIPSVRIRFLETSQGLIYPRFIRRGSMNKGRAGLL